MNTYKLIIERRNHCGGFERIEEVKGFDNARARAREIIKMHLNYSAMTGRRAEVSDSLNTKARMIGATNWDGGCYVEIVKPNDFRLRGKEINKNTLI